MVYIMKFRVDGGCRGNGQADAIGAAAATLECRFSNKHYHQTRSLPKYPTPTNQRAEITAIIMALEWALDKYDSLANNPNCHTTIYSDSRYAVNCMSNWIYKWSRNGWYNTRGVEVVNRDLIQKASNLDDQVSELGHVEYIWIPREQNLDADRYCNEVLDEQQQPGSGNYHRNSYTDSSEDSDSDMSY